MKDTKATVTESTLNRARNMTISHDQQWKFTHEFKVDDVWISQDVYLCILDPGWNKTSWGLPWGLRSPLHPLLHLRNASDVLASDILFCISRRWRGTVSVLELEAESGQNML